MRAVDEHTKLLRVAVDFSSDLDGSFAINITKMKAKIPAEIRDRLSNYVGSWSGQARTRYDRKNHSVSHSELQIEPVPVIKENRDKTVEIISSVAIGPLIFSPNNTPTKGLVISENRKTGQIEILVPQSHDLSSIFTLKGNSENELRKLCLAMLTMLEAVYNKKVKPSRVPVETLKRIYKRLL